MLLTPHIHYNSKVVIQCGHTGAVKARLGSQRGRLTRCGELHTRYRSTGQAMTRHAAALCDMTVMKLLDGVGSVQNRTVASAPEPSFSMKKMSSSQQTCTGSFSSASWEALAFWWKASNNFCTSMLFSFS